MSLKTRFKIILATILTSSIFLVPRIFGLDNSCEKCRENLTAAENKDTAKIEAMPLRLMGTIVESGPHKSITVIKNLRTQRQGVYKVTDKILGYQIVKIMRARVSLLKEGKISFLDFPFGSESVEPIIFVSADERIINRTALAKKILGLNEAMQQAVPIPYIESGKIIGFKLTNLKDKALAKMAGLKEGDVVTRVEGERIDSIQSALEIYHKFRDQEKFNLEIKRGKETKNLIYYMN